jgi:hypothetical protein
MLGFSVIIIKKKGSLIDMLNLIGKCTWLLEKPVLTVKNF